MNDDEAMALALREAEGALAHGDVPVGAGVLHGDQVLASRHNERALSGDPTAHAELLALRDAAAARGSWRLDDCTLVSTLEPCVMCGGALLQTRLGALVYGAADLRGGACLSLYNVCDDPRLNHRVEVRPGVRAEEAAGLLSAFFGDRR